MLQFSFRRFAFQFRPISVSPKRAAWVSVCAESVYDFDYIFSAQIRTVFIFACFALPASAGCGGHECSQLVRFVQHTFAASTRKASIFGVCACVPVLVCVLVVWCDFLCVFRLPALCTLNSVLFICL